MRFQEKALIAFQSGKPSIAEKWSYKAVKADSLFADPLVLLGSIFEERNDTEEAINYFSRGLALNSQKFVDLHVALSALFVEQRNYTEAVFYLSKYLEFSRLNPYKKQSAGKLLELTKFRANAVEHPVLFQPEALNDKINTIADEYVNSITPDNTQLFFTRKALLEADSSGRKIFAENIYSSRWEENIWGKTEIIHFLLNEQENAMGAASISSDGRYLFLSACYRPDGLGSCDIYYSKAQGKSWTSLRNLGSVINSDIWESQPCFSADGRTLYFAAKRSDTYGGSDLYFSVLDSEGKWSVPQNMGEKINTSGNEMAPFIHPDGHTMYFSSEGHPGMGGFDLFISRKDENCEWGETENMGYPLNTEGDEINLIVAPDGETAYISADLMEGKTGFDIYHFKLEKKFQAEPVSYIRGRVLNANTKTLLNAKVEVTDLNTNEIISIAYQDEDAANFLIVLPANKNMAFNIEKRNYLFYSKNIKTDSLNSFINPQIVDFELHPLEIGAELVLNNIFFDTDQYSLKEESEHELNIILKLLKENPSLKLEIGGHTDNDGSIEYNQKLSKNRAKAVCDYLLKKGVEINRLKYRGYGLSKPIADNTTEEGKSRNRRTEIVIL